MALTLRQIVLPLLLSLTLGGCRKKNLDFLDPLPPAPADVSAPAARVPAPDPDDIVAPPVRLPRHRFALQLHRGVRFAETGADVLTMDIFIPVRSDRRPAVLVWFPGGGFVSYIADSPRFDTMVAQGGYAVAVVYYYLSLPSQGPFAYGVRSWPQAYRSAGQALRFLSERAVDYGLDISRLAVGGFSAGGTVAAYLGAGGPLARGSDDGKEEKNPRILAAYIASAPLDFRFYSGPLAEQRAARWPKLHEALSRFLGLPPEDSRARWAVRQANPLSAVRRSAARGDLSRRGPLWWFAHGRLDRVVPVSQSRRLVRVINRAGGAARYREVSNLGHHVAVPSEDGIGRMMRIVEAGP